MKLRLFAVVGVSGLFCNLGCGADADGSSDGTGGAPAISSGGSAGSSGTGAAVGQTSGGAPAVGNGGTVGAGGAPLSTGGSIGAAGSPMSGGASSMGGVSGTGGAPGGAGGAMTGSGGVASGGAAGAAGAGTGGAGGATNDPCEGGMVGLASDKGATARPYGSGDVEFITSTMNQITSLETTLTVPKKPRPSGTLFLWPGLEPLTNSAHYNPVGIGVLQPVLTWGGTCAPTAPNNYESWWISGQYVGNPSSDANHRNCHGGQGMTVEVGEDLHILMSLKGTIWSQVITDTKSGKSVNFDIDMLGQAQNWVIYSIEVPTGTLPVDDIVFTSTVITLANPESSAKWCNPTVRGTNDFFTAPRSSPDNGKCCVAKMILRGAGVPASGPNQ